MRHLSGVLFADIRWIDDVQRIVMDSFGSFGSDDPVELLVEPLRLNVARKPFLSFLQRERLVKGSGDLRKLDVFDGLNSADHLMEELTDRLRKVGEDYPHK
jgi:hypothetical protein